MDDLIAFLRARLDEDEQAAKAMQAVYPTPWDVSDRGHSARVVADEPNFFAVVSIDQDQAPEAGWLSDVVDHVQRWNPDRVHADVAAKRLIIDEHAESDTHECGTCVAAGWGYPEASRDSRPQRLPCRTLRALALPYDDHPDYREEWRP